MKKLLKVACVSAICLSLCLVATLNILKATTGPADRGERKKTFSQPDRVSSIYPGSHKKSIEDSVGSAVRVVSTDTDDGVTSLATGTYFTYNNRYYVLTVAHAVLGPCENLLVVYFEHSAACIEYTSMDVMTDYAIIEIEEMPDRLPLRVPQALQLKKYPKILDKTYYTGYPNSSGPLTFSGTVAGLTDDGLILVQSYAWTGSSGSGVFNHKGNLIGIVMALDVGVTQYGIDVLEDILIVVPVGEIDWFTALHYSGN